MRYKSATSLQAAAAALFAVPFAVSQIITYQGFSNTVSCQGSHFQCIDGGAVCCSLPTGFGYSMQFNNLPAGSQGQGYINGGCSKFLFAVFGPGTKCWNGGGSSATHMNWFHSPQRSRRHAIDVVLEKTTNSAPMNCSVPTSFSYEGKNGIERVIRVPTTVGAAQIIAGLFLANDHESLLLYDDY
ncbi:hypothetical protein HYPSUDRAFT_71305 [Hypholoma sublateritium FD-334 SS-4]|uniref:Uncharacterized protein n=1 Tax=Hypholoma sublateritium (strain FD-334 SS-4) TaxID=945553 RepID=A0A0D2P884_HYPSF|nr:hypothetical protein HYPSUDRAFT_71305 [Hypholoma sublateritium FD-334 SS-4]